MHMIRMVLPPPHFEKGKTLFAGLYIIWIINQKRQQQQKLCGIELNKNYTLIINTFSVQFDLSNKSVVILLACVFCWVLLSNTTRLFYLLYYFILF